MTVRRDRARRCGWTSAAASGSVIGALWPGCARGKSPDRGRAGAEGSACRAGDGKRRKRAAASSGLGQRPVGMVLDPVSGDVDAPADPHLVVLQDVVEEARKTRRPRRPPQDPVVHRHRHHLGLGLALGVEDVEGVLEIGEVFLAGVQAAELAESRIVALV